MKKFYIVCALVAGFNAANAQTSSTNPLYYASGFNVFTKSSVTFTAGDTHGPVATGGDLTLNGATIIGMNSTGTYPNGLNDANNYGLVIGGRINYNSGNVSYVNNGYLRLGNTAGTTLYAVDNNNAGTNLQATSGAFNAQTRVQLQRQQPVASVTTASGLNFTNAFNELNNNSSLINTYSTGNACSNFNYIAVPTTQNPHITLVDNKINYMNLTQAQLSNISNLGSFIFDNHPSASRILIINVTGGGTYNWSTPNVGGVDESDGAYILINFSQVTSLTLGGGNSVYGSVLAPNADVYKTGANNNNGQIVSKSLTIAYGEIHYFPFAGSISTCTNVVYSTPPYRINSFTNTPLPLTAVTLKTTAVNGGQMLSWTAMADNLSASYTAERSNDGKTFTAIRTINAYNTNGVQDYQLTDESAYSTVYYRVRILAKDGTTGYSNTVTVRSTATEGTATVSPMPFHNVLNVKLSNAAADARYNVVMADITGRIVLQTFIEGAASTISGIADLAPGVYMLRITDSNGMPIVAQKVVKD